MVGAGEGSVPSVAEEELRPVLTLPSTALAPRLCSKCCGTAVSADIPARAELCLAPLILVYKTRRGHFPKDPRVVLLCRALALAHRRQGTGHR